MPAVLLERRDLGHEKDDVMPILAAQVVILASQYTDKAGIDRCSDCTFVWPMFRTVRLKPRITVALLKGSLCHSPSLGDAASIEGSCQNESAYGVTSLTLYDNADQS